MDVLFVFLDDPVEVHYRLQSAFRNRIAPANARRPSVGSPIAKPKSVVEMTAVAAIVILMMFSTLIPFCVWYVNYGSALQVYVIYKDFVIILLFIDSSNE